MESKKQPLLSSIFTTIFSTLGGGEVDQEESAPSTDGIYIELSCTIGIPTGILMAAAKLLGISQKDLKEIKDPQQWLDILETLISAIENEEESMLKLIQSFPKSRVNICLKGKGGVDLQILEAILQAIATTRAS